MNNSTTNRKTIFTMSKYDVWDVNGHIAQIEDKMRNDDTDAMSSHIHIHQKKNEKAKLSTEHRVDNDGKG